MLRAPGLLAFSVFAAGKLGIELGRFTDHLPVIWFANAIPLAVILVRPRREWGLCLSGAGIGAIALLVLNGEAVLPSLGAPLCSLATTMAAAALLVRFGAQDILGSWRAVLLFLGFAVSAGTALAAFGAAIVAQAFGTDYAQVWHIRWIGDALGMLIVTPAFAALQRPFTRLHLSPAAALEFAVIAVGLLTAASIGFEGLLRHSQVGQLALMAVLPCVAWAAIRFGCGGAALGNLLFAIAAIAALVTSSGTTVGQPSLIANLEVVQFGLFSIASTTLLFAVLLAERRAGEDRLKATIAKLEHSESELRRQAGVLKSMADLNTLQREHAVAANRAKSDFLATMSHEIRSPLHGIIGYTDLLLDSPLTADQRKHARTVRECGTALVTIIDDVLDFSRIEAGKLELTSEQFNSVEAVHGVASIVRAAAENKGLRLGVNIGDGVPTAVVGDPNRFRQILLNLATNAIKFTEVGEVEISVELLKATAERTTLRISISDTGIGISPEARARLFERFYQVNSGKHRRSGGTGLGLAISKNLVELMGGEIGVESEHGVGSCFWFTVELGRGERKAEADRGEQSSIDAATPARILLVDDLDINRDLAAVFLAEAGHTVDFARDGAEALAAVASNDYDVVLMDVQMPVMDGFEATARIRAMASPKRDVPIIAMTAYATSRDVERCEQAGMNAHLSKPITKHALLRLVNSFTTRGRNGRPAPTLLGDDPLFDSRAIDLLERDAGQEKMLDLVRSIVGKIEPAIERFRCGVLEGAPESLHMEAHRLRSSTALIGLMRLATLFGRIEEQVGPTAEHDSDRLIELIARLSEAADASIPLLRDRLPTRGETLPEPGTAVA